MLLAAAPTGVTQDVTAVIQFARSVFGRPVEWGSTH